MAGEYHIIDSVELTGFDRAKGVFKYRQYTLKTKAGSIITVPLQEKDWSPEKAGPIFLKAAQDEDKIRALTG